MCVSIVCPAPPVGGGGVSVCTCMYGCMYVLVCKYVCVYVCIHVMRVVKLPHKLTYCFFPFSWVDPTHSGGGVTKPDTGIIYVHYIISYIEYSFCTF